MTPETYTFQDDGRIPNSQLAVLIYHDIDAASDDLLVIGAYPDGMSWDLRRGDPAEHDEVVANIRAVPLPSTDPVGGPDGELVGLWRAASR